MTRLDQLRAEADKYIKQYPYGSVAVTVESRQLIALLDVVEAAQQLRHSDANDPKEQLLIRLKLWDVLSALESEETK